MLNGQCSMEYIIKSALTLSILYSLFFVFLRKETFHRFNRLCLLFTLVASLVLPLVHITLQHSSPVNEAVTASTTYITTLPAIVVTPQAEAPLFTWSNVLEGIYWSGLCLMLLYLALQIIQTYQIMQGGLRHTDKNGNTIILKEDIKSPFSIFRFIVMSVEDYENQRHNILTHEQEHIRMGHSYDLLLLEAVKILQWFNPFVWLLEADLEAIHEYQADEAVISQGIDAKQYQQLLVVKAVGNRLQPFANNLRRGSLKKRIIMMYQKKSNRWMMLKALFILPATCFALYAFATPKADVTEPQTKTVQQKKETPKEDPVYDVVENNAQFKGGEAAMYKFITENMKYPQIAIANKKQGRMKVQVLVEKDGTLSDYKIFGNPFGDDEAGKALEEEGLRVLKLTSGNWTPAKVKGKTVRSHFVIPIVFRMN